MQHALTKKQAVAIIADEIASLIGHENPAILFDAPWLIANVLKCVNKKDWNIFFERYLDGTDFFISMFICTRKNLNKFEAEDWLSTEEANDLREKIEERFCNSKTLRQACERFSTTEQPARGYEIFLHTVIFISETWRAEKEYLREHPLDELDEDEDEYEIDGKVYRFKRE
ncbi:MAG: hypothetical protein IJP90_03370 [Treponema sp.]|nr:hypothetical protein [Treponema sp.]MBR0098737.1 hypothetical protein [Treponema sp.]